MKVLPIPVFGGLLLIAAVLPAAADPVIFHYNESNAEPYAFISGDRLEGGIIKDIGDAIAAELGLEAEYLNTPRLRNEQYMLTGKLHVLLISNPAWIENSGRFKWSVPFFTETDIILVPAQKDADIKSFDDLDGKTVGTISGFHYPEEIQQKFDKGIAIRSDVATFEQNIRKLRTGRIDCLIYSNILVDYYLKKHDLQNDFKVASKTVSSHEIMAMLSPAAKLAVEDINRILSEMLTDGRMDVVFAKYK